jgi:GNAT superfamily N-acetyltransferase
MVQADVRAVLPPPAWIRDFQTDDYPALAELSNAVDPDRPTTEAELRHDDEVYKGGPFLHHRYVATDPTSRELLGEGSYFHIPWSFSPERFGVWFAVRPDRQGGGIGRLLYLRVLADLERLGARQIRTWTQESRSEAFGFLFRRGFEPLTWTWESRLDVAAFRITEFADRWAIPAGIEITTLAAETAKDPEALHEMYELDCELAVDVPRHDPFTPPGFELYRHQLLESPRAMPDAHFLAKDGDRYVGVSDLERLDALPGVLHTGFTGVRREYRGRGIAFALKLRAIDYAIRHGIREIRTGNSTLNAPMLGINERLGFVKQPMWINFGKDLTG